MRPSTDDMFRFVSDHGIWVQILDAKAPVLALHRGGQSCKAAICSIPKSGTHLIAALLERVGVVSCGIHAREDAFTDYRFGTMREHREEHDQRRVSCPLEGVVHLVQDGQFIQGHLPCSETVRRALAGFRVIFTHRELRACMVSQMRFFVRTGRGSGKGESWREAKNHEAFLGYFRLDGEFFLRGRVEPMLAWLREPGVVAVSYEALMGDLGEASQASCLASVCELVGVSVAAGREALAAALGTETMTRSAKRSVTEDYWSDEAEAMFQRHGGVEMNRALGYDR